MGIQQGALWPGPAGRTLKAWAVIQHSTGAVLAGSGITFSSRGGVGNNIMSVGAGLISNHLAAVVVCRPGGGGTGQVAGGFANLTSATALQSQGTVGGSASDNGSMHVELWE